MKRTKKFKIVLPQVLVDWDPSIIETSLAQDQTHNATKNSPGNKPNSSLSVTTVGKKNLASLVSQKGLESAGKNTQQSFWVISTRLVNVLGSRVLIDVDTHDLLVNVSSCSSNAFLSMFAILMQSTRSKVA